MLPYIDVPLGSTSVVHYFIPHINDIAWSEHPKIQTQLLRSLTQSWCSIAASKDISKDRANFDILKR